MTAAASFGAGAVLAQLRGHAVKPLEDLYEARRELRPDRGKAAGGRSVADAADLLHEALEEDRVPGLVDLLGGQEVLLLLKRRGVDVGREVVGDGVLAPEEEGVVPDRGRALELGEALLPLLGVLAEVDVHRAPVAVLPAPVEILVGDRVCGQAADLGAVAAGGRPVALRFRAPWTLRHGARHLFAPLSVARPAIL